MNSNQEAAAAGVYYDNGGETPVNKVSQNNAINGFRPGVSLSRAMWKYQFTLRLERNRTTPNSRGTNAVLSIRISSFLF